MNKIELNNKNSPCLKCKMRFIGCHDICADYNEYKNELKKIRIIKKKEEKIKRNYYTARKNNKSKEFIDD